MLDFIKRLMPDTLIEVLKKFLFKNYYLEIDEVLDELDPNIATIFDIGANEGHISSIFLKKFKKSTVYSFEPSKSVYNLLENKLKYWIISGRSKIFRFGFYNDEKIATLNVTNFSGANSLIEISSEYHLLNPHIKRVETESIKLIKLDDFVSQHNLTHIDLVKIDVEGVEKEVLLGGEHTFRNAVDIVILEISFIRKSRTNAEYLEILKLMHEFGFAPSRIFDLAHSNIERIWKLGQLDCVFRKISK